LINEEMVGLKNYSAASDLLRLLIIYKEGGIYFDTDTVLRKPSFSKLETFKGALGDMMLLYGFKFNVMVDNREFVIANGAPMLCTSGHPILEAAMIYTLYQYKESSSQLSQKRIPSSS